MMIKWDNVHYSLSTLLDKEQNSFQKAYNSFYYFSFLCDPEEVT